MASEVSQKFFTVLNTDRLASPASDNHAYVLKYDPATKQITIDGNKLSQDQWEKGSFPVKLSNQILGWREKSFTWGLVDVVENYDFKIAQDLLEQYKASKKNSSSQNAE